MGYGVLKSGLTPNLLRRLVRAFAGPGERILGAARCRGGLFNTTYRVRLLSGRTVVLRVAPPPGRTMLGVERGLMRREVRVADWMACAGLPAPALIHTDFSRRLLPRDWLVAECAPGSNWHYRAGGLPDRENDALSAQLGRLAARMHAVANPDGWFGYPAPFRKHRTWSGFVRAYAELLERDLRTFKCDGLPRDLGPAALAERMAKVLDEIRVPRLLHGDLWPRNVLFEREGGQVRITALLDCDRGLWGDPRFEWVLYGYPFRPSFWSVYGPREPAGRSSQRRNLLYRGCGALQAAIEEWGHFRHRAKARVLMEAAIRDLAELKRCLPGG